MGILGFHRTTKLLSMCLSFMLAFVIAAAISMVAPAPAESTCQVNPPPAQTEGVYFSYTFNGSSVAPCNGCYDTLIKPKSVTPPLPAGLFWNGVTLSGTPPPGSANTYTICFYCQEYVPKPYTNPQGAPVPYPCPCTNANYCYPTAPGCCVCPCVYFIINPAPPTAPPNVNQQIQVQGQSQTVIVAPSSAPPVAPPTSTNYKYTISVMGLTDGTTASVAVDGGALADMTTGDTRTLDGVAGQSYTVTVPSNIQGKQGVKYEITGSASKTANANNPSVSFTYNVLYRVDFKTVPDGVALLSGSGWVPGGTQVGSSAPATVKGSDNNDLIFDHWSGPGGDSRYTSVSFTANAPATYIAFYNTKAIAPTCSMDYFWIIILALAIVIVGGILAWRRGKSSPTQVITVSTAPQPARSEEKPAPSESKTTVTSKFCPECGDPMGPNEKFCDKCGAKRKDE